MRISHANIADTCGIRKIDWTLPVYHFWSCSSALVKRQVRDP